MDLVVTQGLGDNSYMVYSGDEAAVVDPQRDVDRFLSLAEDRQVRIRYAFETHVHNDYLTGALDIRASTGAEVVAPAKGGYRFPHRSAAEGDETNVGGLSFVALETPGHTPDHVAYLVREDGQGGKPVAIFTGGSLMVGGAGRTDLLGSELTDQLTRAQYRTLHRLAELGGDIDVLPTHGAGSFCGAGPAPRNRTSTIGDERRHNGAMAAPDEAAFVKRQLSGLLAYPTYYANLAPINRAGPRLRADIAQPKAMRPEGAAARMAAGVWVVDGRGRSDFAKAHIAGSVNVELDAAFASYVGWVVPFNEPIALVLPQPEDEALQEARTQLLRIGYERVEGNVAGGIDAWFEAGKPVRSYPTAGIKDLCEAFHRRSVPRVLDVRQQTEWDEGHIPGSLHVFVGDLPGRLAEVPSNEEVWTACASGHRAAIAASLLDQAGVPVRLVASGGVADWLAECPHG